MSEDLKKEIIQLLKEALQIEHRYDGLSDHLELSVFGEVVSTVDVTPEGRLS